MDLPCPVCGEPWDVFSLAEVAQETGQSPAQVRRIFRTKGCGEAFASWGASPCKAPADKGSQDRLAVLSELAHLLGDDVDGYAAMAEDFDAIYG